ncbi:MAG: FHA domain-containing protein [Clostridia bacterium]|nr:FHA domain-containing protein [Clostridia bacterium]
MDEQKVHKLILIVILFNVLCIAVLAILEPLFAVLWLLLFLLLCLIIKIVRPEIWEVEASRVRGAVGNVKHKMNNVPKDESVRDLNNRPAFKLIGEKAKDGINADISKDVFLIGRSNAADCKIIGYDTVGRRHCRIVYRKYSQEYYIEDLRSSNGTYLGTHKLEPFTQYKLVEGTDINIGGCHIRFVRQ